MNPPDPLPWLANDGEMARLIRAMDWTSTPLGPIESWSNTLRVAVGIVLANKIPMFVWWGEQLVNIYNDAYAPLLGKRHPHALGRPAKETWNDIWNVVGPQAELVMKRGEATWNDRELLVMERHGYTEETYFTWSYSPIRDESGAVLGLFCACTEETGRVIAERERERLAAQRQLALDASQMGWWHYDPVSSIATYDARYAEIFGVTGTERPNDEILKLIHPDDLGPLWRRVEAALDPRDPKPFAAEYRVMRSDGSTRWVEAHGLATFTGTGSARTATSFVGTVADITEQKRAFEAEQRARSAAEQANRMKDEFLATLSHELRTPMNAILGWVKILRDESHAGKSDKGLAIIDRNARVQAQMIEDLLDMSAIVSGKVRLDVKRLDPASIAQNAIETMRPGAEAKGISIRLHADRPLALVAGDAGRLQQVMWNLLSNAVKFTPRDGSVDVSVTNVDSEVQLTVRDTGEGIEPEFLPYVFERFRQADGSTTRRHGGLGLGLSIVKQIVELHGGRVLVESAGRGLGTAFSVILPAASTIASDVSASSGVVADAPADDSIRANSVAGLQVLVVDDEPDSRALVCQVLEDRGALVRCVASADEAFAAMTVDRPDVVVSDLAMPGTDGYQMVARMRTLASTRDIPAIAMTAHARAEDRVRSLRAGFQMHLPKPIDAEELVAVVATLAGRSTD